MSAPKFQTQRVAPRSASPVVRQLFETLRARRISLESAADYMGISYVGLHHWKSGKTTPRIDSIELLAARIGCRLVLEELPDASP